MGHFLLGVSPSIAAIQQKRLVSAGLDGQDGIFISVSGVWLFLHVVSLSSRIIWTSYLAAQGSKGQGRKLAVLLQAGLGTSTASLSLYFIGQSHCRPAEIFSLGSKQVANFGTGYHVFLKGEHASN